MEKRLRANCGMSEKRPVYCPRCKELIPGGRGRCPSCGGSPVYLLEIGHAPKNVEAPPLQNFVIILLSVIIVALGFALIVQPNLPVNVSRNVEVVCSVSGKQVEMKTETTKVRRKDAGAYETYVRQTVECEGDVAEGFGVKNGDIVISRDNFAVQTGKGYGDDVAYIRKDMTHSQVLSLWGEPLAVEKLMFDDHNVERWVYGDPLYGIRITGRYVDFDGDTVGQLFLEKEMFNLYQDVVAERRAR